MSQRVERRRDGRKQEAKPKSFAEQADEIGDWLESIQKSPFRFFRMIWHRHAILDYALAGCDDALASYKTSDKVRRNIALIVTALGGPSIDWGKQATKGD